MSALRLRVDGYIPWPWQGTREELGSPALSRSVGFPVPGRGAVRVIADFGLNTRGQVLGPEGQYECVLEGSTHEGSLRWRKLLRFTLAVRAVEETLRSRYIPYSNDPEYYDLMRGIDPPVGDAST